MPPATSLFARLLSGHKPMLAGEEANASDIARLFYQNTHDIQETEVSGRRTLQAWIHRDEERKKQDGTYNPPAAVPDVNSTRDPVRDSREEDVDADVDVDVDRSVGKFRLRSTRMMTEEEKEKESKREGKRKREKETFVFENGKEASVQEEGEKGTTKRLLQRKEEEEKKKEKEEKHGPISVKNSVEDTVGREETEPEKTAPVSPKNNLSARIANELRDAIRYDFINIIAASFLFVTALSWNSTLNEFFDNIPSLRSSSKLIYSITVTVLAVLFIRIASRIVKKKKSESSSS